MASIATSSMATRAPDGRGSTDDLHQREPARPGRRPRRMAASRASRGGGRGRSRRQRRRRLAGRPGAARAKALSDAATALEQRSAEITDLVVREVGKPLSEARGEVARGVAILRYYAQAALLPDGETIPAAAADQLLMARHVPVGVAALIDAVELPRRHPALEGRAEPRLRQRDDTQAVERGGGDGARPGGDPWRRLPQDVFQVVLGGAAAAGRLIDHPDVAAVSFTGSSEVGRQISRRVAERGCRVQAEMGGQNPSVVLADADLDRAATAIAYAVDGIRRPEMHCHQPRDRRGRGLPAVPRPPGRCHRGAPGARPGRRQDAGGPGHRRRLAGRQHWPPWLLLAAG